MIEINNLKQMEKYYDKELNGYIFDDNVCCYFDFCADKNIYAYDITAYSIIARNIYACDIKADYINTNYINAIDITANNINAYDIKANDINANDINAYDIKANDITANDIRAIHIDANNISFYAFCCVYESLKCKSIKGRRRQNKIICLDNDIEIKGE